MFKDSQPAFRHGAANLLEQIVGNVREGWIGRPRLDGVKQFNAQVGEADDDPATAPPAVDHMYQAVADNQCGEGTEGNAPSHVEVAGGAGQGELGFALEF